MFNKVLGVTALSCVLLLSGCGGGGLNSGDSAAFSVLDTAVTYKNCTGGVGGSPEDVTSHVIVGGQSPFRIKSLSPEQLLIGSLNASKAFVAASSFDGEGFWVLEGRDPSFAIQVVAMPCDSEATVLVLDSMSTPIVVKISTQSATTTTAD